MATLTRLAARTRGFLLRNLSRVVSTRIFLNLNLTNNEDRAFNELTLRFYVTAKPEAIEAQPGQNNQPGTCPLLVDEDICQAYDEAGFNRPCVNQAGESVDDSLRYYLRPCYRMQR